MMFILAAEPGGRPASLPDDPSRPWSYPTAAIVGLILVLALGVGLRLRSYYSLDGLMHDDTLVCSNIIQYDELRLLRPLGLNQAAPVGHLLLTKELVRALGTGEKTLRLPALASSILVILLSARLFSRITRPAGCILGVALLATSPTMLFYASTAKQYSGDVLASVVLLIAGFHALATRGGFSRFAWLGVAGFVALFFSQPSAFLLGGIGLTLILTSVVDRRYRDALAWAVVASLWLSTFVGLFLLIYKDYAANDYLKTFWKGAFAPFPPRSLEDLKWYGDTFFGVFGGTMGLRFTGLAGFFFLLGVARMIRQGRGRELSLLLSPLLLTLAASALHKYPFGDRLLLFACPILAGLIGVGLAGLLDASSAGSRTVAALAFAVILVYPAYMTFKVLKGGPYVDHDIKPALAYVSGHYREGDRIFLDSNATAMTNYYRDVLDSRDLKRLPFTHGRYAGDGLGADQQRDFYGKELEPYRGEGRFWVIFAMNHQRIEPIMLPLLDRLGVRVDAFHGRGSSAFLYDLSRSGPAPAPRASRRSRPEELNPIDQPVEDSRGS